MCVKYGHRGRGGEGESCAWCITLPTVWLLPSHQRTKGCLCQAWLISFLLMSYLRFSPTVSRQHSPPPKGASETAATSFAFVCHPSTHTQCTVGLSEMCHLFSPTGWSTRTDVHSHSSFFSSPWAIYTVEKVNCLKHQRCNFIWVQKHCIWYHTDEITVMINCVYAPTIGTYSKSRYALWR